MVDGFKGYHDANIWLRFKSEDYLQQKGLPKGTKLNVVGDDYW
jgi:hypothetical protein